MRLVLAATAAALVLSPAADARRVKWKTATASWYQLTGNTLGCGGKMYEGQLGVANKSLPCGSKIRLMYRGHKITVRVIDRGPYAGSRSFDLTRATRDRLGYVTDTILHWRKVR